MSKGCQLAQILPRSYDDRHPADLVSEPERKARRYLREAALRTAIFDDEARTFAEALKHAIRARLALGQAPSLEAQKAVYDALQELCFTGENRLEFRYLDAVEVIGEAEQHLRATAGANSNDFPLKRQANRLQRLAALHERTTRENKELIAKLREEEETIKTALPDYDRIAPKIVWESSDLFGQ